MSDVCLYELEDIVANDLYQCDDHVVPCVERDSLKCDSGKRLCQGARNMECGVGDLAFARQICLEKAEQANLIIKHQRNNMLEKEIWSKKSFSGLASWNSDSVNEASTLATDGTSNHCFMSNLQSTRSEICVNDPIINDKSAEDNNSYDCQLDHISEVDNDLTFLGNNQDGKPSNDLLHYSWSDIGNFDDVDRMFRSYDSTFGQATSHEDNLGWVSMSNATGGSEDTFKLDSNFSCPDSSSLRSIPEKDDMSRFNGMSFQGESGQYGDPSSNGSGCSGYKNGNDDFMPNEQINERNTRSKHQSQSDFSETEQYFENSPVFYVENVAESGQQQDEALDSQLFGYLQDDTPYMSSEYNCRPDQTSLHPQRSVIKSENRSLASFSLKDSYSLNQTQSTDGSKESSLQAISFASEKREQIHQERGFQASESVNPENVELAVQASKCGTTTDNAVPYNGEIQIDGEVNMGVSFDVGSSAQYSSMNSGLSDISLEATSFRQLQNAMQRLDLRTKLCIRDSLYRLAQSAEQRNQYVNMKDVSIDERNKFTSFMDIETETNPIDRSIAHLLFHRPADSTGLANHDSSFNSPATMHGSSSNSPVKADGSIKREETAAVSDMNVAENLVNVQGLRP